MIADSFAGHLTTPYQMWRFCCIFVHFHFPTPHQLLRLRGVEWDEGTSTALGPEGNSFWSGCLPPSGAKSILPTSFFKRAVMSGRPTVRFADALSKKYTAFCHILNFRKSHEVS